jgi:hypothetical protein
VVYLLCLPYRCSASSPSSGGKTDPPNQWHSIDQLFSEGRVAHTFPSTWKPKYLVANGKKKRRNCVVVEEDKRQWKVLDLEEFRSGGGSVESEGEGEGESMVFD